MEENSNNYTIEEATEIGTQKLEKEIEAEIENKEKILNKSANVKETPEYVEVSVIYEVVENIGMQEKIEETYEQTEEEQ